MGYEKNGFSPELATDAVSKNAAPDVCVDGAQWVVYVKLKSKCKKGYGGETHPRTENIKVGLGIDCARERHTLLLATAEIYAALAYGSCEFSSEQIVFKKFESTHRSRFRRL